MSKIGPLETKFRLLLGTGKSENEATQTKTIKATEANVLTLAVRRMNLYDKNLPNPSANISLKDFITFPNTAGTKTAEGAIHTVEIAKHAGAHDMIKVEVIGDDGILLPDPFETYEARKVLLEGGYTVCPRISNDVVSAKRLEELGVHAVMPLTFPIGTGRGINSQLNLSYIIKHSNAFVIVDADIGSPKDACHATELGVDAIPLNAAASGVRDPVKMAEAMKLGIHAGRLLYEARRIPVKYTVQAPSPTEGLGFL